MIPALIVLGCAIALSPFIGGYFAYRKIKIIKSRSLKASSVAEKVWQATGVKKGSLSPIPSYKGKELLSHLKIESGSKMLQVRLAHHPQHTLIKGDQEFQVIPFMENKDTN